ncbi:MarR family transcriptional regulator [Sphingomonas sp.]|uniref:MarR family transcriptional regulator n=1 Tax=Sphingomonas sp. TaxID=28214 RepID=UPI00180AFB12|nr:MarR family transcriptional regulator [Sphingomonas sp.]MBA3512389.1 MarR family transcriptional regulator [Sphingomonas sp.]
MDAYLTDERNPQFGFDRPPILIAGDSDAALERAARTVEASGLRIADRVGLDEAPGRIDRQVAASALWVELESDRGASMDRLLDHVNRDAGHGRYQAIVAAPSELLDMVAARLTDGSVELLVDGDDADRAAALAVALTGSHRPERLSDVGSDRNAIRLRQLSDEVSRIASTLARLSTGPASVARPTEQPPTAGDVPEVSAEMVRTVIRARRLRSRYFDENIFADPAWDMLLDLLQAEIAQLRVPVSSLCIAASVPATTALRWLKSMTQQGMFVRRADPHDGRRVFVELAPQTSQSLRRYFADVGRPVTV